mmetsp:Transcript_25339/g.47300  ORF Transcript_25339/g.47300 Transcript_25339/m.47300 type:complete len:125 (-) Transcript_25339:256-630(-)
MDRFTSRPVREKLRDGPGIRQVFAQIGMDTFVVQPILCWPIFYLFKEAIDPGRTESRRKPGAVVETAMAKYKANFWSDNIRMSGFWIPACTACYSVPVHYRMPLMHTLSFAWVSLLSVFRGPST